MKVGQALHRNETNGAFRCSLSNYNVRYFREINLKQLSGGKKFHYA